MNAALRTLTIAGGLILALTLPGFADLRTAPARRPSGVVSSSPTARGLDQTVEVARGGSVKIVFRGVSSWGGQLEFCILGKPSAGRLRQGQRIAGDQYEMTYFHKGRSGKTDSVVFGVRAAGAGPYSPGKITVRIIDQPALLSGPEQVTFPVVDIGQSATQTLVVSNDGNLPAAGRVQISPPWRIEGDTAYRIPGGGTTAFEVTFSPAKAGPVTGRLLLQGDALLEVPLLGSGRGPFSVPGPRLILKPGSAGGWTGQLPVENTTSGPVTVQIESPFGLPSSIELRFGEAREIPVVIPPGSPASGVIRLQSESYRVEVEVLGK